MAKGFLRERLTPNISSVINCRKENGSLSNGRLTNFTETGPLKNSGR